MTITFPAPTADWGTPIGFTTWVDYELGPPRLHPNKRRSKRRPGGRRTAFRFRYLQPRYFPL